MEAASKLQMDRLWWQEVTPKANSWYGLGIIVLTLISLAAPYVLGAFIPCAQFMEIEWVFVGLLCLSCVGALNIYFAIAPKIESFLPTSVVAIARNILLALIPILVALWSLYISFSPFWWALLNDPDLICD